MPTDIHDVLRAFESLAPVKQVKPNQWKTLCPCHQENTPSLYITLDTSTGGVALKDFGNDCSFEDIAYAVGLEPIDFADYETQKDYEKRKYEKEEAPKSPIKFDKAKTKKKEGENNMADSTGENLDGLGKIIEEDADNQTGEQWLMIKVPDDKKDADIKDTYYNAKFERSHIYRNGNRKVIYKHDDGEKEAYQDHWDLETQSWKHGKNKLAQNMLYMPDLEHPNLKDVNIIFFCEGEKDCDRLYKEYKEYFEDGNFMTVSKPNGAGSDLERQFIKELKGKKVFVFYDNDDTGRKSAVDICNALKHQQTYLIKLKDIWPDIPEHGDVSDYLDTHPDDGKENLADLINNTKRYDDSEPTFPNPKNYNLDYNWDFGNLNSSLYELSDDGVWESHKKMVGKNEEIVRTHITETPMWISGIYVNSEKAVDTEKLEFRYIIDGRTKMWILPRSVLFNSTKAINALPDLGISVDSTTIKGLIVYLRKQSALNRKRIPNILSTDHFGWATDSDGNLAFVPYSDKVKFDAISRFKDTAKAIQTKGNYYAWLGAATTCRAYSWGVRLAMDASCASLIIGPTNSNPFFVHMYSNKSGSGKTVALMVCASAIGNPKDGQGLVTDFNATDVSMEINASVLNSIPFFVDELQEQNLQKDGRRKSQLQIYELTQGSGKNRSNPDLGLNEKRKWACSFITTGETSLLGTDSASGGENRIVEIRAKQDEYFVDKVLAHDIVDTILENYGFAGEKIVNYLMEGSRLADIKKKVNKIENEFMKHDITNKQAQIGALIVVMDEILNECIFDDENSWTVEDILKFDILKKDADINNAEKQYNQLMSLLSANESHFYIDGVFTEQKINECWGKTNDKYIYLNDFIFSKICNDNGLSEKAILDYAFENNILVPRNDGKSKKKWVKIACMSDRKVAVYQFAIQNSNDDDEGEHFKENQYENDSQDDNIEFSINEDYSEYPFN